MKHILLVFLISIGCYGMEKTIFSGQMKQKIEDLKALLQKQKKGSSPEIKIGVPYMAKNKVGIMIATVDSLLEIHDATNRLISQQLITYVNNDLVVFDPSDLKDFTLIT